MRKSDGVHLSYFIKKEENLDCDENPRRLEISCMLKFVDSKSIFASFIT